MVHSSSWIYLHIIIRYDFYLQSREIIWFVITMEDQKPLVIYVPGLYSSTLAPTEKGGVLGCIRDKWNPPSSVLVTLLKGNRGHSGLSLPLTWSKDESKGIYVQDKDDIEPQDCLKSVHSEFFQFLETLNTNGLIELHTIIWDWRRSFEEAENKISSTIETICSTNKRKAILITHSTGAMLSWPTINEHPEWFNSWVNAAGCFLFTNNSFLAEFERGWSQTSVSVICKEAFFSFPGLYSYFAVKEEDFVGEGQSDFVSPDGSSFYTRDEIDLQNVETWETFKLGIFSWKKSAVTEQEREHLKHCLEASKRYRTKHLLKDGKIHDPSFLDKDLSSYDHLDIVCYGTDSKQTHSSYAVNMQDKTIDTSTSSLKTTGDGTLMSQNWKTVPGGLKSTIVMAEEGSNHVRLLNDKKLRELLLKTFFSKDELKKVAAVSLLEGK